MAEFDNDILGSAAAAAPTLTFGEEPKTEEAVEEKKEEEKKPIIDESVLTPEERAQAEAFADKIDIRDSNGILSYGAGTQKKMADFSTKTLDSVRTKDMGEVGDMVTDLINQLKNFDVDEKETGLKALFGKSKNKMSSMKANYSKVETNVEVITKELEHHQQVLLKDIAMLDQMYALNLNYYKELTMYIIAGKKKLEEVRSTELKAAQEKAAKSGLAEDAQAANDLADQCNRFEKKLYDLELTRTVAMQTAPQIRMIQGADTTMAEKIQTTIVNTIPLWKSQMVIAIGVEHSNQAAQAQKEVSDMTNELLRKNADKLKTATVTAAKESERGIVDIETLKHTNEQLISTLDEVLTIQQDGRAKRVEAEKELADIESELKEKLLLASRS